MSNEEKLIEIREKENLDSALSLADTVLKRSYLPPLQNLFPVEKYKYTDVNDVSREVNANTRFIQLEKIVLNKNENLRDKLVSVYKSLANVNSSISLLINGSETEVSFYLATRCNNSEKVAEASTILSNAIAGDFPGTEKKTLRNESSESNGVKKILSCLNDSTYISAVSAIPALRSDKEDKEHEFVQGIEKFIDTMRGKKYSMVLVADSKTKEDIEISRRSLENLYSQLAPFAESSYTYGENESESINHAITTGVTHTISKTITDSVTHTVGTSHSESDTNGFSVNVYGGVRIGPANLGGGGGYNHSHTSSDATNYSEAKGRSEANGTSDSTNESKTQGNTSTEGSSRQIQIKFENHGVKKLMERIDNQLKRYDQCADLGMWNCASYFLGETSDVPVIAATTYQSLICGKNSSLENDYIINWDSEKSSFVKPYLLHFEHPDFDGITPGTLVSSAELAIAAGFPNHAVPGLPVLECTEFGRNVASYDLIENNDSKIHLGKIFHMNHEEELPVELDTNSLTSHVFITGSTGAGKSNTVYQILNETRMRGKKFLVIEPAKGEYKDVFGGYSDVTVYGTNPTKTEMLKINPFSFPKEVHILEHLDRLIEIFNVCWPMYAAMPAVLKEAVEKSYEDAGWDLGESKNKYSPSFYPTFEDVMRNVREIIDSSDYDKENKGAYKGSLVTRLKSLTNGLNGMIFVSDDTDCFGKEIGDKNSLFEKNTIIDLSRVGSQETKSLLMGLLVLKLQEYRMAERDKNGELNSGLRHITVLEEAHNLLKRTSTEQSSESANLAGKSVEMISNAIAEMRTYGEGFIIADQAPGLLDMAAIRNTNTKIIMRLPDMSDRELVGKAANLNDDQITELAKLPRGVAAVYQNEWVQSVLCKVDKFTDGKEFSFKVDEDKKEDEIERRIKIATMLSKGEWRSKEDALKELCDLNISGVAKFKAVEILMNPPNEPKITKLGPIMSALFPKVYSCAEKTYNENKDKPNSWSEYIRQSLPAEIGESDNEIIVNYIIQSVLYNYVVDKIHDSERFAKWYAEPNLGGAK